MKLMITTENLEYPIDDLEMKDGDLSERQWEKRKEPLIMSCWFWWSRKKGGSKELFLNHHQYP
jgi:hypothetical protein